jgi:hypothetical protein
VGGGEAKQGIVTARKTLIGRKNFIEIVLLITRISAGI